ncbi:MAG: hypothetical protein OXH34_06915, partial [Bacteroidetes bacterium]|nr:hypothetical protein [Bacteroidota bacterium]
VDTMPEPERKLLELMLEEGAPMIEYILGNMGLEEFQEGPSRELVGALVALYHEHTGESDKLDSIDVGQLQLSALGRQLAAGLLIRQHEISKKWEERKIEVPKLNQNPKRIAKDCMRRVKRKLIKGEMKELMSGITTAEEGSEAQLELQEEYRKKSQYLISLEKGEILEG